MMLACYCIEQYFNCEIIVVSFFLKNSCVVVETEISLFTVQ